MEKTNNFTVIPLILESPSTLRSFNFYLLKQEDSLVLIDAGIQTDECWQLFYQTLDSHGYSIADIDSILVTHNHEDHTGLINRIVRHSPIPIYAPVDSIPRLKRDPAFFLKRVRFFESLYNEMGCGEQGKQQVESLKEAMKKNEAKRIGGTINGIGEGDVINRLEVIATPGHSSDHVVYYHKESKALFGGDHLISHISSNALIEPDQNGKRLYSLLNYIESLKKIEKLEVNVVYSGHGKPVFHHKELIQKRLDRIDQKAKMFMRLINDGHTTAAAIAKAHYKNTYNKQFSLVMSEVIGHLDYLEYHRFISKRKINNLWEYYTITELL